MECVIGVIDAAIQAARPSLGEIGARLLVATMEESAEDAPVIEYCDEAWMQQFPNDRVQTPIGEVKMGNNQKAKLVSRGRTGQFGMIKPTLENPDVILYEKDSLPPEGVDRMGKLLFIKTFKGKRGESITHFESVTIRKDNLEIAISSHIIDKQTLLEKLQRDDVIHTKEALLSNSSEGRLAEQIESVPDLVPTQESNASSGSKDTNKFENTRKGDGLF